MVRVGGDRRVAVAKRFGALGFELILVARRADKLAVVRGGDRRARQDRGARRHRSRRRHERELASVSGDVDVLVNNAGGAIGMGKANEADLDDWDAMIDVNCKGLAYVTRAILPGMVKRDSGHVINLGSVAGGYAYPGGNVYGASKAFVAMLSQNLRADLFVDTYPRHRDRSRHGRRHRVLTGALQAGDQAKADKTYEGFEALTADDVAECVVWAASLPSRVNVNRIEVMSVMQSFAGFSVKRS